MALFTVKSECRACGSINLSRVIDLGESALANSFLHKKDFIYEKRVPLEVYFCEDCFLTQLTTVVDKEILFNRYVYFYSAMPQAPKHFVDYAEYVIAKFISDRNKDFILEIGSNDGLLLQVFKSRRCNKILGIDPAKNIARLANKKGIPTIADFFDPVSATKIYKKNGKARVVIANNTAAHIDDLHGLIKGVRLLLDEKGVFVFEVPYLLDMFENLAFDSIYHEHLSYFSVTPLIGLFKKYNMDIFDIKEVQRQGNSIRVFVGMSGVYPISSSVGRLLRKEQKLGLHKLESYFMLNEKIKKSKFKLNYILNDLKRKGYKIAAYGCPARGNTVLNYCKIDSDILDFATEELPSKIGTFSPGMHVPVIDVKQARNNLPNYFLLLSWNYKNEILSKEEKFIKKGGRFIIPVDGVKIL